MMRTAVIIPCNSTKYIDEIVAILSKEDCSIIVVLDRISHTFAENDKLVVLHNTDGIGFLAGKCRDMGLDYAIERGYDEFIFIDCDCIPQVGLVALHHKYLSVDVPVCTAGRRLERKYTWRDKRDDDLMNIEPFGKSGLLVNNPYLIKTCMFLWSCNFGINRRAVKLAKSMMVNYFGTSRMFHPGFDGVWGGEDSFLGYILWSCKVLMYYLPRGKNAVTHNEHDQVRTMEHKKCLDDLVQTLSEKLKTNPLTPLFFST